MSRRVKRRNSGSRRNTDMAQRALAEYEEAERRRYHERLRAERKRSMSTTEMSRLEAIEIVDRTHFQYLETIRTSSCVSCEAKGSVQEVDYSELPASFQEADDELAEFLEQRPDGYGSWGFTHRDDCSFIAYWKDLPTFCERMGIRLKLATVAISMPNGQTWVMPAEIRDPDPGDPPNVR
jgi:hypothetical protein